MAKYCIIFFLLTSCASKPKTDPWVEGCIFGTAETIKAIFERELEHEGINHIAFQCSVMSEYLNGQKQ